MSDCRFGVSPVNYPDPDYESVWHNIWPQNKCRSLWPIFHGPLILPYILKTIRCMNTILLDYESVWPDVWCKNKIGHCDLYFMVLWFCLISWKLIGWTSYFGTMNQYDPIWHQNIYRSLWPIFHGPLILPYILKTICCMNIILWDYESIWHDIWPQNKCKTLWYIFHGPVILPYILKTYLLYEHHTLGLWVSMTQYLT